MYKTPQQFYDAFNGIGVNRGVGWNDSAFGYQCVAGFKAYCEFEGVPVIPTGNGYADGYWYDRYKNGMSKYFTFIDDISELKQGDWCIWAQGSSCKSSHIAMLWKKVNKTHAQFFGQNQSGHPYFTLENIKLDLLGAYRLKEDAPQKIKMYGIDVSKHNSLDIDISQYDFVIIRACWGTNVDEKAEAWRLKCEQLGIPYGVYLYTYALSVNDAIDEADFICDMVKDWNIQMGIWIDMENDSYKDVHGSWNQPLCSAVCQVFCQTVQQRGYYTGIYASQSVFGTFIQGCDEFDKWVASWGTNDGTIQRDTSDMGTMLQYTSIDKDNMETYIDEYGKAYQVPRPLDKDVAYCELDHYKSFPMSEKEPIVVPVPKEDEQTPKEDEKPSQEPEKDEKQDIVIPENPDDGYLFKMSNKTYDFFNWVVHITPLFITLYIALSNIWKLPYTEPIVATISAVMVFISSILKQSTIGYKEKDGK